jgi:uncharacterized protein YyaL (SSP411 family)/aryl-alcohol dehydrogenase-like predicted oxidoreductase
VSETASPAAHTNRLIDSTSPYLLQHAHNPVDWYPWGEEALRRAKAEDKPILLSIGYSACHWCHVMERESFEDERIAALMNESFVCVKVDREERPDLDEIYMAATQAMTGHGGWPMTVFLTPGQQPFFAGTYFPPEDKYGRPGFATLLRNIAQLWREKKSDLESQAAQLSEHLRQAMRPAAPLPVGAAELDKAVSQYAADFDPRFGGFGHAPKFPPSTGLLLLLRHHRRVAGRAASEVGPGVLDAEHTLEMVRRTLDGMARGGMYDQIGGGFCRYSVDERWLVPHFEKMLYDNALLARVYVEAFQTTGEPFYRMIATEILDYVLREMTSPEGGFYSATDADSEGEEGKFFVWTPKEIEDVLGREEARRFCAYYDITEEGNWEGKSIPNVRRTVEQVAASLGIEPDDLRRSIEEGRRQVYEARLKRVAPGLDDKILTAWNGLLIGALAEGARVLGEARYLEAAQRAAMFIRTRLARPDAGLFRTYRAGKAHLDAYLEDYAYLADALIDLYEAGGDVGHLFEAQRLAERMIADFGDQDGDEAAGDGGSASGGFFSTARQHEKLLLRHREGADGATPSANAVAAHALARLSFHFDREDLRQTAMRALAAYGRTIARMPRAFATSLIVVDFLLEGPVELAFVGTPGDAAFDALRREAVRHYLPNRIIGHLDPGAERATGAPRGQRTTSSGRAEAYDLPLLAGKTLVDGRPALYVCRNFACQAPITDPAQVAAGLLQPEGAPAGERGNGSGPGSARQRVIGSFLQGGATPGDTAAYAAHHIVNLGTDAYGPLGSTGLTISRLGFGGYRVDDETPEHREALQMALERGINLIDTSTNYTGGGSERLIGAVLAEQVRGGSLRREEVVVVTKVGYVQGENLALAREREAAGQPFPEMVKYIDGVWHSIHPEFLRAQLARSLARLGLETVDVCLLHNPEYFLSDAKRLGEVDRAGRAGPHPGEKRPGKEGAGRGQERSGQAAGAGRPLILAPDGIPAPTDGTDLETTRREFYRRIREAFRYLESEVGAGRIHWYGVSSNTVAAPDADPEGTSLARMLQAAREAGGEEHHFRVLQLPMNLFEAEAVLELKEGLVVRQTVLDYARGEGVAVLVNRPLNAIAGGTMLRLADVEVDEPVPGVELEAQLQTVANLEDEYRREIAGHLRARPGRPPPEDLFRWSEQLRQLPPHLQSLDQWEQIESAAILLPLTQIVAALERSLKGKPAEKWPAWRDRYLVELQRLLDEIRRGAAEKSRVASEAIAAAIDPHITEDHRVHPLSRKALWVLASTPGVSAVLNGMREAEYVEDALEVLRWPPLPDVTRVYRSVRALQIRAAAAMR